jgi:hypothetical protein
MKLIEAKTVGAGGIASIEFTAIPQTYTDLKIYASTRDNRAGQPNDDLAVQVGYNGTINTGSIYTFRRIWGNGSASNSDSNSGTALFCGMSSGATSTANVFGNNELYFSYYNSSVAKSVLITGTSENNDATAWQVINQGSIATNDPITDIKIYGADANLFSENTTFYLYGVTSASVGAKATGGNITYDSTYWYHTFLASGTFTPTQSLTADYLVVAGGGGAGNDNSGGGGAGGLRSTVTASGGSPGTVETALSLTAQAYTVTVGGGGAGSTNPNVKGVSGSNSVFSTITSTGGGGGGSDGAGYREGTTGGSGGGGASNNGGAQNWAGGSGTENQGYAGGRGYGVGGGGWLNHRGGGGGGAGAAGVAGNVSSTGGNGGNGVAVAISGSSVYYAGGGAGGTQSTTASTGGLGGGGNGGSGNPGSAGGNGTTNLGGGGAGGGGSGGNGGSGGSGIVIVRYAK